MGLTLLSKPIKKNFTIETALNMYKSPKHWRQLL